MSRCSSFALGLMLIGGGALAGDVPTRFDRMDRDGDGRLSPEEFRNAMLRVYTDLDRDGDGTLSSDEQPPLRDRDGKAIERAPIKIAELAAAIDLMFAQVDADGDGFLSRAEFDGSVASKQEG